MHTDTEPLPADLGTPRPDRREDIRALVGTITGGVLLVITVVGFIYAVSL